LLRSFLNYSFDQNVFKMLLSEEKRLLVLLKQGDIPAFQLIYQNYFNKIFSFCFKIFRSETECAEIVQNVFIALWEQREKIDEEKLFSSYLFGIAKNITYQALRTHLFRSAFWEHYVNAIEEFSDITQDEIYYNDLKIKLEQLIDQLPAKRKMIFRFSRFYGLTYKQIAEKLFISENTVDTQMRESIRYLKDSYNKLFEK